MAELTRVSDVLSALRYLDADTEVTISVRVGDLQQALEAKAGALGGGPETLDAKQASARFGYAPERWRRWCEKGRIVGAWQDATGGPWRLPRASCEELIRQLQGRAPTKLATPTVPQSRSPRRQPRGPRKKSVTTRSSENSVIPLEDARSTRPHPA